MTLETKISQQQLTEHDLWLGGGEKVLTVSLDGQGKSFPPDPGQVASITGTINLLARAAKSVLAAAESGSDTAFEMQPIEGIADAIILLTTLQEAVQSKIDASALAKV